MSGSQTPIEPVPRDAATVILLRQEGSGLEVYLMERNKERGPFAGMHVFPGGVMEEADCEAAPGAAFDPASLLGEPGLPPLRALGLFRAAVRETFEETGVLLAMDRLLPFARWITPVAMRKRFDTRFFLAEIRPGETPRPDGNELTSAAWMAPSRALEGQSRGEIRLVPPTLMMLAQLSVFDSAGSLMAYAARHRAAPVLPHAFVRAGVHGVMLPHDPEYPEGKNKRPERPGEPSRLLLREGIWEAVCPGPEEIEADRGGKERGA